MPYLYYCYLIVLHANAYLDSSLSGLDAVSTGYLLAVFFSLLYSCLHWSDAECNERCPYISRHSFPVVEARDWLSSCSLERVDWLHQARWPPLICTRQVKATSRLLPTALALIGRLSTALSSTHWSKYTPLLKGKEGCVSTFCDGLPASQSLYDKNYVTVLSFNVNVFFRKRVNSYTANECDATYYIESSMYYKACVQWKVILYNQSQRRCIR